MHWIIAFNVPKHPGIYLLVEDWELERRSYRRVSQTQLS